MIDAAAQGPVATVAPPRGRLNALGLEFDHFGLAVPAPDEAFRFLAALGYREGAATFDPLQQVNLAMCYHDTMPAVEVVWPDKGPSPIDAFIKRGSLIYHLCYACEDPEEAVRRMAAAGLDVLAVAPAKPAILFGGERVSFHVVRDFGLIELIERPGRGKGASS